MNHIMEPSGRTIGETTGHPRDTPEKLIGIATAGVGAITTVAVQVA